MPVGSWTNITNAQLATGAPVRSVDHLALRDNAIYANAIRGQVFTANGTFTIPQGVEAIKATVVGGGGNGGGNNGDFFGGAGGGSGFAFSFLTGLTSGNTIAVTVGGAGGFSRIASGTQTITTVTANAGAGGQGADPSSYGHGAGGGGGSATGGQINNSGESGLNGGFQYSFGWGGRSIYGSSVAYGSGGYSSSAGKQGIVIFEW